MLSCAARPSIAIVGIIVVFMVLAWPFIVIMVHVVFISIVIIVSIVSDMFMMHGVIVVVHGDVVSVVRSGVMSASIIVSISLIVSMAFNMSAFLAQRMV